MFSAALVFFDVLFERGVGFKELPDCHGFLGEGHAQVLDLVLQVRCLLYCCYGGNGAVPQLVVLLGHQLVLCCQLGHSGLQVVHCGQIVRSLPVQARFRFRAGVLDEPHPCPLLPEHVIVMAAAKSEPLCGDYFLDQECPLASEVRYQGLLVLHDRGLVLDLVPVLVVNGL